ncbi:ABC transporter permease [Paenibacillus sacheonensis]|uniref:ABC transporter permease subunit n=1 Tax=Paenibacillus sacheonensis TaxID=742054 RepID=A0A7X4YPC6_9BACL|nr:ABC transporter permease [Paenibacillus sacheonensis]MBM7564562.1 oligopeptide transport system permease protein [Paenibacillus sacheonensis]NBC69119.1 ABC transporter permease subunit [Paenibacillus sacheonensis]
MSQTAPSPFERLEHKHQEAEVIATESRSTWQITWARLRSNRWAMTGLYILIVIAVLSIVCPILSPYTSYTNNLDNTYAAPSSKHWFGTDNLGRDLFTRTWLGVRISLTVGIAAALFDLIIGIIYGGIMGYAGKRLGGAMNKIAEMLYAIPHLLVVILLSVVMGSSLTTIIIALSITGWITMSWIVRGQILQLKNQEYVLAAQSMGASNSRILFKHLIPNTLGPIIVTVTLSVPSAIFAEAFLSFLGLGVQSPAASLGTLIGEALSSWTIYPWMMFIPASLLSITMLAFNIFGDGLQDAFDPKMKK